MGNIIELRTNKSIQKVLRDIADDIDKGVISPESVTLIAIPHIYQIGTFGGNDAAYETIFSCNFAIHKLMAAAMGINA